VKEVALGRQIRMFCGPHELYWKIMSIVTPFLRDTGMNTTMIPKHLSSEYKRWMERVTKMVTARNAQRSMKMKRGTFIYKPGKLFGVSTPQEILLRQHDLSI